MRNLLTVILLLVVGGLFGEWLQQTYLDEFGDPTDIKYINHVMVGTFSNSASDDAPAYITCIYTKGLGFLEFDVSEYKANNKANFSSGFHALYVKDDKGEKTKYTDLLSMYKGSLMLEAEKIIEQIKKNNKLKMIIITEDSRTSYNFTMDCTGFSKALKYFK